MKLAEGGQAQNSGTLEDAEVAAKEDRCLLLSPALTSTFQRP